MRKRVLTALAASAAGVAVLLTGLTLWSTPPSSQTGGAASADSPSASALPLTHVHLFTSGVGYFQREGVVEGNARIDLTFPVHNINDLLKSMVLQDLDGGRVSVVGYDSHDPVDKTLRGFAINLNGNPSYGQILNQARGEKVEVGLQGASTLTGTILGVEKQRQAVGKAAVVETEVLNLWSPEGMRSVKLADVQRIRFLNPAVDRDIRQALEVLARTRDHQKKTVTLTFEGQGKRRVRIGYVIENPIWKTSYRLLLGKNGKPSLQGWAVVDNPTDEDWKDVRLALVSGRPLSFQMDLYTPIYVPRPRVELELFAGLRPPIHDGRMDWMAAQREVLAKRQAIWSPGGTGTRPRVKAEAVGEFFQYVLEHPVSLPRQKSALFPILDRKLEGTPVSIYNQGVQAKHPLLGLRFKNTTGLYLMQGPVTVFADGSYAGDALLPNLQPGEERLISYAIDLGTEVDPRVSNPSERLVTVRIDKGILYATTKVREAKTYVARNRSPHERVLLIEHPVRPGFTLVNPELDDVRVPGERTRDLYRFQVKVPAGKTVTFEVVEERTVVVEVVLTDADDQTVLRYLSSAPPGGALRDALTKARELRGKLVATRRAIAQTERQLKRIVEDQARLRANMERVPKDSAAYQRYLKKFDEQETEIERLQEAVRRLQATEQEQRQAYEEFLANLNVSTPTGLGGLVRWAAAEGMASGGR
jgi:hypothetical protein